MPLLKLAALLLLCSCAAVSPTSRMSDVAIKSPHSWASTKEARSGVDEAWLARFGDSKLQSLVAEALGNNLDMKVAAARLQKARGQAELAGVADVPTLDLAFAPSRNKRNFVGFPMFGGAADPNAGPTTIQNNQFNLNLNLNWEIDLWGRIAAGKSSAKANYEAAQQDYKAARTSLAAQVAKAWFQLTEARAQLALAKEAQATFAETATAVSERFKAGAEAGGAAAQLRLSEADVASAKAAFAERDQMTKALARQLEVLLGRYPAGSIAGGSKMPTLSRAVPSGLPSELLQRRPDILAAERRHASQGEKIKEGWRSIYPRFALTASSGRSSQELGDLLKSEFGVWQLAGNVLQPIFAGGRIIGEIKVYYADESETLSQLESTILKAFGEVETALSNDRDLGARQSAIDEAVRLAADADKAAKADYRDGVGDILTVLAAQSRWVSWRSQSLAVQRLRLENRVNLHLALGGDFTLHGKVPELPTPKAENSVKLWWKHLKKE
jgi:outer membrane protein, multidrug efflux system